MKKKIFILLENILREVKGTKNYLSEAKLDLTNYKDLPGFSEQPLDRKNFDIGAILQTKLPAENVDPVKMNSIYRKYPPGTKVKLLGKARVTKNSQQTLIVNPLGTNEVYRVFPYYLQDAFTELEQPKKRLKKVLTGEMECSNCHQIFDLKIPGGKHRDHCPKCLASVHIDISPGSRDAWCGEEIDGKWIPSKLLPIGLTHSNKLLVNPEEGAESIVYQCEKCNRISRIRTAQDDNRNLLSQLPYGKVISKNNKIVDFKKL